MPVDISEFKEGTNPKRGKIQSKVYKLLKANPTKAFSAADLQEIFEVRRQAIIQTIHSLTDKEMTISGMVKEGKRKVMYVTINLKEGEENESI